MAYTTTELIAKIKLWGAIPPSQPAFTTTQLLDLATDELWSVTVPFINDLREEYFVTYSDSTISTAERQTFDIPSRAAGGLLRDVKLVNDSNDEEDIPRIDLEYQQRHFWGFYIQGNKLHLIKSEDYSTYSLRMYYYVRPSQLVATSRCAQVSSVGTTTFDVTSVPSNITDGDTVDIVQANPPFETLSLGVTASISGTTITPSTMPTGLAVGDRMCLKEESCIPQIPLESHTLLVRGTVVRVQEILQDNKGIDTNKKKYEEEKAAIANVLTPRVVGEREKIKNYESFLYGNRDRIRDWYT